MDDAKLNINFNKNATYMKEMEKLGDKTMETFSILVGNALYQSETFRTDNNSPLEGSKCYFVCPDTIPELIKILSEDNGFFRFNNITTVKVLSNEDYERRLRKLYAVDEMGETYIQNNVPLLKDVLEEREKINKDAREIMMHKETGELMTKGQLNKIKETIN